MKNSAFRSVLAVCAVVASFAVVGAEAPDEVPFKEGDGPPSANPGEMWCLVVRPATYKTVTEQVLIQPATFFLEMVPAKFETKEETIQVAPETKRACVVPAKFKCEKFQQIVREECVSYEIIPAEYNTVEEQVVVRAAGETLSVSPATYKTVSEQILVAPARRYWKKVSSGKVDKRDENGDCYCMCEVPAKYVTVCRQVLDKEGTQTKVPITAQTKCVKVRKMVKAPEVKKVTVPAEYVTMEREIIDVPASVTYETVPAKFETIQKEVQVAPETTRKVEIPAKYETTSHSVLDQPAKMVWKKGKCKCDCNEIVSKYKEIPGTDIESLMKLK